MSLKKAISGPGTSGWVEAWHRMVSFRSERPYKSCSFNNTDSLVC